VLDEEYRKAGKMDTSQFCTSFNLAEYPNMETVTQALVKSAFRDKKRKVVTAELYKLNVSTS
jgi:hypothetical protein